MFISSKLLMHFLTMGGYAAYVWSAYGVVVFSLIYVVAITKKQQQHCKKQLIKSMQKNARNS